MDSAATDLRISSKDFLDGELIASTKHEYVAGRVYAMSGGSMNHQRVARNFSREIGNGLKGKPCETTNSDFLLRVPLPSDNEAFYYPDGMVICHPISGQDRFTESPTVILEVLSESTRRIDETQKLRDYLTIPSLKVFLLAEADEPTLRVYRRNEDKFEVTVLLGLEEILDLPEVEMTLPLAELYRDVEALEKLD